MSLRPFGRNKVLVTDANGKMVSQTDQSNADLVVDEVTAGTGFTGDLTGNVTGDVTGDVTGGIVATSYKAQAPVVDATETSVAVTAAQTGTIFYATANANTKTFTLPTPAAGLTYTFVAGGADGEVIIKPNAAGQSIVGKGISVSHSAGIENDAGTNAVGDLITVVAVSSTVWLITAMLGTWSTDAS